MTNNELIAALKQRKLAIEAAMLQTAYGSHEQSLLWEAFQKASKRYWQAAVWLHDGLNQSIVNACK